jgi:hypothetical protein
MRTLSSALTIVVMAFTAACGGGGNGGVLDTPYRDTAPPKSTLSGTVQDAAGAPVAGVVVSVFHHNTNTTATATTDAQGHYSLPGQDTTVNADYAVYAEKAGLSLVPSVGDAAGQVTRFDFNGFYRTVIRFAVMPGRDVNSANFTAYRVGDRLMSLASTGQKASYAAGDDGQLGRGVAWSTTRFADNHNGSITDQLTGLVWLKNAGCLAPSHWAEAVAAANQLASGACGLSDGSAAGQWRLPNANELESLVDVSQANPAVAAGHPFNGIQTAVAYWTSTSYSAAPSQAMAIRMTDGRWINGVDLADGSFNNAKTASLNGVWAVRSGGPGAVRLLATGVYAGVGGTSAVAGDDASLQLGVTIGPQRFIDPGDGTLVDTVTGLVWLKQADCIVQPWVNALGAVSALASGQCGLSDGSAAGQWRVPNRAEMLSLSDRAPTFPQASYLYGQYRGDGSVTGPVVFRNFVVSQFYGNADQGPEFVKPLRRDGSILRMMK